MSHSLTPEQIQAIAERSLCSTTKREPFVPVTPSERDALVAAARGWPVPSGTLSATTTPAELRSLEHRAKPQAKTRRHTCRDASFVAAYNGGAGCPACRLGGIRSGEARRAKRHQP